MARRFRTALLATVAVAVGLMLPLLLAEVALQFSPVLSGLYQEPVDAAHPIGHFEPGHDFTYSIGLRFETVVHGRTNNIGWVNDQDYDSTATSPLLAVIGDSYVEALMVPYRETLQGRLAALAGGAARVYSFGASGAPLSHYLMEADYARRTFHPTTAAVVVVGNDFDESLRKYKVAPGLWGFAGDSAGHFREQLEPYHTSTWKRLVRRSALVRYLILNVKLDAMVAGWRARRAAPAARGATPVVFAGNVRADADSVKLADSRRVVDEFLSRLPAASGVAPACVALVVDGVRPQLYDARRIVAGDSSYFGRMRVYLMQRARSGGFQVVDLQPAFVADYARSHRLFDFPEDGHWNVHGHEVAAVATAQTTAFTALMGSPGAAGCASPMQ